jgi:hypothetical protein
VRGQIGSKPVLCATRLRRFAHSSLPAFALRAQAGKKLIPKASRANILRAGRSLQELSVGGLDGTAIGALDRGADHEPAA